MRVSSGVAAIASGAGGDSRLQFKIMSQPAVKFFKLLSTSRLRRLTALPVRSLFNLIFIKLISFQLDLHVMVQFMSLIKSRLKCCHWQGLVALATVTGNVGALYETTNLSNTLQALTSLAC